MKSIIKAVSYCHANGICHRDLKLENFLFQTEDEDSDLKLIDFGLSLAFKPYQQFKSAVGTPYYVAPEVLNGTYDNSCDVWAIGVIAYMLLTGKPPFNGPDERAILNEVATAELKFHPKLFKNVSQDAQNFIQKCMNRNHTLRPSADMLLAHKWFRVMETSAEAGTEPLDTEILDALSSFQKQSKLQKLCMNVVAHTLSHEQIKELTAEFSKFDTNQTG